MFTGLIEELGKVNSVKKISQGLELSISCQKILSDLKLGDSISINGVCSTVTASNNQSFTVQYSGETLSKTRIKKYQPGQQVNLELCLTPTTRLGGHIVTGHIDDIGQVTKASFVNGFGELSVKFNPMHSPLLVQKGSITIDGISLTISNLSDNEFACSIIEHTYKNTNLKDLKTGDQVHLEFDIIGKYVQKLYNKSDNKDSKMLNLLNKSGFIND